MLATRTALSALARRARIEADARVWAALLRQAARDAVGDGFAGGVVAREDARAAGGEASVDDQAFAGDEARLVARQEERGVCDVLGQPGFRPWLSIAQHVRQHTGLSALEQRR